MIGSLNRLLVEGLWLRFKSVALALHRQDRLESAQDFAGWLNALPADDAQVGDIALNLTLRALRVATDPVNYRILRRLRAETGVSVSELMAGTGLSRIPLHEHISDLMQAGLVVQELGSEEVRATQVADGVVDLVEVTRNSLHQTIMERLQEIAP